jgi:hypothetical protein
MLIIEFTNKRRKNMKSSSILRILGIAIILAGVLIATLTATTQAGDKVTICHAAGLDTTTHYIKITISVNAAFGQAGHFYENGTPRAGHEQDFIVDELHPCGVIYQ